MGYTRLSRTELNAEFDGMLGGSDIKICELAGAARNLLYSILPELTEIIWTRQKISGYGTGPKKMTEHFCYIAPCKSHVDLGFNYGSELPDPSGLLEGSGKLMRHIKIKSLKELDSEAIEALIRAATTHRVPPIKKV